MAPLWIITCGQMIFGSEVSTGSYASIVLKLLFLIGPLTVGAIIQWWFSCSTEFFMQTLTWLLHMYINCVVICLIIVNFELFSPKFFKYSWKVMENSSFKCFVLNLISFSYIFISFFYADHYCLCSDILLVGLWLLYSNRNSMTHQKLWLRLFQKIFRLLTQYCKCAHFFQESSCTCLYSAWLLL